MRRSARRLEQVERVADGVHPAGRGQHDPGGISATGQDRGPPDYQGEQQYVADGIGEVGGHRQGITTNRTQDRVEGKACTDRRHAKTGNAAVQPRGRDQRSGLPAHDQHQCHVGEWIEAKVESIGK
ncbi:MAG: hypothetical protein E6I33_09115 [Chloroflexi bacterium]|nr:MAG: hypothetical protein E6I55_08420 [Chloroflexota bacterium]TMF14440.1 MAG: hypothetical protein E6I33_09115 [Chloroflexota bacterium]